jgi:hypothetical protein
LNGNMAVETASMSHADWRNPSAYEELRSLDAPGFAWEYLRRNPDFQQERRKLEQANRRGALNQTEVAAFARRWGVRFRRRRRNKQSHLGSMGSPRPAKRHRFNRPSG